MTQTWIEPFDWLPEPNPFPWKPISQAPRDGTKIIGLMGPNPTGANPHFAWASVIQWKEDGWQGRWIGGQHMNCVVYPIFWIEAPPGFELPD